VPLLPQIDPAFAILSAGDPAEALDNERKIARALLGLALRGSRDFTEAQSRSRMNRWESHATGRPNDRSHPESRSDL
jgi:hypothetical protein